MSVILSIVNRNMKKYLRDKASVFFSFLSVIMVLALYLLFLGDMQIQSIESVVNNLPNAGDRSKDIAYMVNTWLVAGLLAVNTITIPISILSQKVEDKYNKISDDFNATPAKRYQIVLGYIIASWIIGLATSLVILIIGEAYIVIKGGALLSFVGLLQVLGVVSLSIIMFSGLFYLIITFVKTTAQLAVINTIVGTLAGFLGGIYVPLGVLGSVGKVLKVLPLSYIASLLRKTLMSSSITGVFEGAPAAAVTDMRLFYGVDIKVGAHEMASWEMLLILAACSVVFYAVSMILYTKLKRKSS